MRTRWWMCTSIGFINRQLIQLEPAENLAERRGEKSLEFDRGSLNGKKHSQGDKSTASTILKVIIGIAGVIGLICLGVGGLFFYTILNEGNRTREAATDGTTIDRSGSSNFSGTNSKISSNKGQTAFGNTAAAKELASKFSENVQTMRELFFTKRKKEAKVSLSKGAFLTYCQLIDDACVFLVHIPDLRNFTADAKQSLADIAWDAAQETVRNGVNPPPKRIAVATRGVLLYDQVLVGSFQQDEDTDESGIEYRGKGTTATQELLPFFASPSTVDHPTAPVETSESAPADQPSE